MTEGAPVSRRRLLCGMVAAAGGAAALGGVRPWRVLVAVVPQTPRSRLVGLFSHRESARAVGRAYLDGAGHEGSSSLVDRIVADLPGGRTALMRTGNHELREMISSIIRADFETGRVVEVSGWMLSSTEARLYALAALS